MARIWEEVLGVRKVGREDNFFELGGNSLLAARLFAEVEKGWGKILPLVTLLEAPTLEQLARALGQDRGDAAWSSLVAIQPRGSMPPFFCVHGVGGNVLSYQNLVPYLSPDQPLYGLQAQGLDRRRLPYTRVEDMAAHYIRDIQTLQPAGPYYLGGISFGGVVAFEAARQLRARGHQVGLLALLDTFGPGHDNRPVPLRHKLGVHLSGLRQQGWREFARERARGLRWRLVWSAWKVAYELCAALRRPLPRKFWNVTLANRQAYLDYAPAAYPGRVILLRAKEQPAGTHPDLGWGRLAAGGVEIRDVPGNHKSIIEEPHVRDLAEALDRCLARRKWT